MTHSGIKSHRCSLKSDGFMLIEVLVALALFGLAAVFLVDGVSFASRTMRLMKDTREMEQDLLWAEPDFQGASVENLRTGEK